MIKKLIFLLIICSLITNVFANVPAFKYLINQNEQASWTIAAQEDGYFQLLGLHDDKKFIVQVSDLYNSLPSDTITIHCNTGNGQIGRYDVAAGTTLTCYPHFHDVITIAIVPQNFKNGATGNFRYEFYKHTNKENKLKKNRFFL
ncbi:Uncharacterised protein [Legionella beliardensis]|uniref:Secreted protein n=1 Tax=Legionella beliardensis TaxID=91822 RepID=A0A378I3D3_9GAMM|nr:hypothetical protein [Legionella beliardensis]STX29211.1 Uncharacterised protein [Legionella beliardensis]